MGSYFSLGAATSVWVEMFCHLLPQILAWAFLLARTNAAPAVTVYGIYGVQPQDEIGQGPLATKNVNMDFLNTLQAYNNVSLQVPSLLVQTASQFSLALANSADKIVGGNLSQAEKGDFIGLWIEMRVVESVSECYGCEQVVQVCLRCRKAMTSGCCDQRAEG